MNGLCDLFEQSHSFLASFYFDESCDGFDAMEVLSNDQPSQVQTTRISSDNVVPWLDRNMGASGNIRPGNSAPLRIVWVNVDVDTISPWRMGIQKTNMDLILEHFGIRRAYAYMFTYSRGLIHLPTSDTAQPKKEFYSLFGFNQLRLLWTHNTSTGNVEALCVGTQRHCGTMQNIIIHLKTLFWHPLFLAIAVSVLTISAIEHAVNTSFTSIVEVEMRTRHSYWDESHWISAEGSYASLSAKMSGCATTLATCECDRKFLDQILDEISKHALPASSLTQDGSDKMKIEFYQCVRILEQRSINAEAFLRNCSRRVDIQLTAVSDTPPI